MNAGHKGGSLSSYLTDTNMIRFARDAEDVSANIDVVAAGGQILTGQKAHCRIVAAVCVWIERGLTDGRVIAASGVVSECETTDGRVGGAGGEGKESTGTRGGIPIAIASIGRRRRKKRSRRRRKRKAAEHEQD